MTKTRKQMVCWILIVVMMFALVACAKSGGGADPATTTGPASAKVQETTEAKESTEPEKTSEDVTEVATETTVKATEPKETTEATVAESKPKETEGAAKGNEEETTPPATEAPATEAPQTEPPVTEVPATQPPATEHQHSYTASVIAPTCSENGYTYYSCSCGSAYTDSETAATGHSWGEWATTVEATTSAPGEQARVCAYCGITELQPIAQLPAEVIDTAALEEYGRNYAVSTYGYQANTSLGPDVYCGYYPASRRVITTMSEGYGYVASKIDSDTAELVAIHGSVVKEIDGVSIGMGINVGVQHIEDNIYAITFYYG